MSMGLSIGGEKAQNSWRVEFKGVIGFRQKGSKFLLNLRLAEGSIKISNKLRDRETKKRQKGNLNIWGGYREPKTGELPLTTFWRDKVLRKGEEG